MARRLTLDTVLTDAAKIKEMWSENPPFSVPGLTAAEHAAQEASVRAQEAEIDAVRAHLAGLIEKRDGDVRELNAWNVRIRRGVGFAYGLESPQYKMVGGTPPSERKPAARKPKPAP